MTETVQDARADEPRVVEGLYFLNPIERHLICWALRKIRPSPTRTVQTILDRLGPTAGERAANQAFILSKIQR